MHLIALGLKKQLNIKWIADFRDPWTNIDFYKDLMLTKAADKKHHRLEKEVLQTADEVVTIGKTMAKEFENIRNSEVRVITNGYDADDFEWKEKTESDKFIIVHVGSINADRNHKIFWQALKEICDENQDFNKHLQLRFIGKLDYSVIESVEQFNLKDQFEQVEYVSHDKVKDYLFESDVLYLPLNNTPNAKGILSGKFFEYLAVGKSILGIGHPQGDAAEIMTEVKAGSMIDFDNYQGVKDFLLQEFSKRNEVKSIDLENRKGYSRKSLTADLVSLF
jgi:glycosyltransferase involved in cell wall biosynthesis